MTFETEKRVHPLNVIASGVSDFFVFTHQICFLFVLVGFYGFFVISFSSSSENIITLLPYFLCTKIEIMRKYTI